MAIRNISAELGNVISGASTRVRAIGRTLSEHPANPFQRRNMIGQNISRIGVFSGHNAAQGTNTGFAGSNLASNPFIFGSSSGFNKGSIQDAATYYTQRRFGRMDSNLGYNRIPGLQRGSSFK
jgi:hypothetical protein